MGLDICRWKPSMGGTPSGGTTGAAVGDMNSAWCASSVCSSRRKSSWPPHPRRQPAQSRGMHLGARVTDQVNDALALGVGCPHHLTRLLVRHRRPEPRQHLCSHPRQNPPPPSLRPSVPAPSSVLESPNTYPPKPPASAVSQPAAPTSCIGAHEECTRRESR
eukprot:445868-Rhodomonas_salina.1